MGNSPRTLQPLREDWQRALCVVAHPDDLEYGAASAVARWTSQGKEISYLLATRGEAGMDGVDPEKAGPLRVAEQRAGALEVGVDTVEFLDYPDGTVEYGLPLRRDITRAIRKAKPDVIISYAFTERLAGRITNQADHRAVGLATLDAARDAGNRWIFPELAEEGLHPWTGVRFVCFGSAPQPSHGVDVTDFLHAGIASLAAHREYMLGLGEAAFDPTGLLTSAATAYGERLGVGRAVAFDVFEIIPDTATLEARA
ncbi:PIG-L deacetylase family protein [Actinocrispum sp. NPDC049592]|uniref:PIG-L deacetylase family protein n=1 Tax=Actinocrispum sp. NPDC049592 TaxID=3154835 RepID=UPI00341FAAB1